MFEFRNLEKIPFTIMNITEVLLPIFELIQEYEGSNIVLLLSDRNVGKTTLLTSLIYGPESLTDCEFYDQTARTKKKKIIEHKELKKDYKIGHECDITQTIIPSFYRE